MNNFMMPFKLNIVIQIMPKYLFTCLYQQQPTLRIKLPCNKKAVTIL